MKSLRISFDSKREPDLRVAFPQWRINQIPQGFAPPFLIPHSSLLTPITPHSFGIASFARDDRSMNQVYSPFQPSLTVPSEPLRCLAMISSAMFFSGVSGS